MEIFSSFEGKCRRAGEGFAASMRHLVEREEGGGFREKGLPRPELQTLLLSFRSCSTQNPSSSFQSIIQTWNVLDALQPPFFAVSSTSIPKARPLSRTFPPWRPAEISALLHLIVVTPLITPTLEIACAGAGALKRS